MCDLKKEQETSVFATTTYNFPPYSSGNWGSSSRGRASKRWSRQQVNWSNHAFGIPVYVRQLVGVLQHLVQHLSQKRLVRKDTACNKKRSMLDHQYLACFVAGLGLHIASVLKQRATCVVSSNWHICLHVRRSWSLGVIATCLMLCRYLLCVLHSMFWAMHVVCSCAHCGFLCMIHAVGVATSMDFFMSHSQHARSSPLVLVVSLSSHACTSTSLSSQTPLHVVVYLELRKGQTPWCTSASLGEEYAGRMYFFDEVVRFQPWRYERVLSAWGVPGCVSDTVYASCFLIDQTCNASSS